MYIMWADFVKILMQYICSHVSFSTGSYASYLIPAAALGAMGYCYMKWKVRPTYD